MIDIKVTLSSIDWESCVDFAFPVILEKITSSDKPELIKKALNANGTSLKSIVKKTLNKLSDAEKNELIKWGINSYESKILTAVSRILEKKKLSECVKVGSISANSGMASGQVELCVNGIDIDYSDKAVQKLLSDKLSVKLPTGLTGFLGRTAESAVIKLLSARVCSEKICQIADNKLASLGIKADISSLELTKHTDNSTVKAATGSGHKMPDRLEECIIRITGEILSELED